jgi:hypothetical protein
MSLQEIVEFQSFRFAVRKYIYISSVLYGFETWSLTLREEHRLRMFENRVLRGTFGPERHNEALHNLYSSPSIIRIIESRRMRWTGHLARMGRRGLHIGFWWESRKEGDD